MEIIELLKLVTLTVVIMALLTSATPPFPEPFANLASTPKGMLKKVKKLIVKYPEKTKQNLALLQRSKGLIRNAINSLNWTTRLFQYANQLFYKLGPNQVQLQRSLNNCKSKSDVEDCITKVANELFDCIMNSDSKYYKEKALQAADSSVNDATAAYLIEHTTLDKVEKLTNNLQSLSFKEQAEFIPITNFKNISSTIKSLSVYGIKVINKNCANAKKILKTEYNILDTSMIDSSIWLLLTQLGLYKSFAKEFTWITIDSTDTSYGIFYLIPYIVELIKYKIVLRADVNILRLLNSIRDNRLQKDRIFPWYNYIVKNSPFKDAQLYDTKINWESVSESLLLDDPKSVRDTFDMHLSVKERGTYNYLLLSQDNPKGRSARLKPDSIDKMYSCFILVSRIGLSWYELGYVRGIPKERYTEMAEYLAEINKVNANNMIWGSHGFYPIHKFYTIHEVSNSLPTLYKQLRVSYLSLVSLFGDKGKTFNMNYARVFAQMPETLELLAVIGDAKIKLRDFYGKSFSEYLFERSNWDEAVKEHFHFFISLLMNRNIGRIAKRLEEYIGVDIREALATNREYRRLECINCTLDQVPRHLSSYFDIIYKALQNELVHQTRYLEIAVTGSLFNGKAAKEDFVYHQIKYSKSLTGYLKTPVFLGLAQIHYKYNTLIHETKEFLPFLHFERLVHEYFPGLVRMDQRGFKRLYAKKDSFSIALRIVIEKNFVNYSFPFALADLQDLEKELINYHPMITMGIKLEKISMMALLKAIYMALSDPSDLKLAFIKNLFNAQLLYKSLA